MSLIPHSDYQRIRFRLKTLVPQTIPLRQHVYRMINPHYCRNADILNGVGGMRADGRWNSRDRFHCTYTSCSPETALLEVLTATRRKGLPDETALPRTLVCLTLDIRKVLDLTSGSVRQHMRIARQRILDEEWWLENQAGREAWTQTIGRAAAEAGFEAIMTPSAADHAKGINIIVFPENLGALSKWAVITPISHKK